MPKVFVWDNSTGGCEWYRILEPMRAMKLAGMEVVRSNELNLSELEDVDVVYARVLSQPAGLAGWQQLKAMGKRLVFDIDDDVWNFSPLHHPGVYQEWTTERLTIVELCAQMADLVTTPSPVLSEIMEGLNANTTVIPNTVPEWVTELPIPSPLNFTLGWSGGSTHANDIDYVSDQLAGFLRDYKYCRLNLYGPETYKGPFRNRVTLKPWQRSVPDFYKSLEMSVALAPIDDRLVFNEAKSDIRAVEAAALGIPCIASPILYNSFVSHGYNGFLAEHDEWYELLVELYQDSTQRYQMGINARHRVRKERTTEVNVPLWEWAIWPRSLSAEAQTNCPPLSNP